MRSVVAWYQIVGGAAGLAVMSVLPLFTRAQLGGSSLLVALPFLCVLVAGVLLSRRHPLGSPFTIVAQLSQLVFFAQGGYVYHFGAGVLLGEWIQQDRLRFHAGVDLTFMFSWGQSDIPAMIGVNVMPLIMLALLWQSTRSAKRVEAMEVGKRAEAV
jgi:hypothetical protein